MRFVALDPSLTKTGVAIGELDDDGAHVLTTTVKTSERLRGAARLHTILVGLSKLILQPRRADLVAIENYAFGKANQAHQLGELGGVVRLWLYEKKIPFVVVPPAVLKGIATGKGGGKNASKDHVLTEAVRRLDYRGADNNQADAGWLLTMMFEHYHGTAVSLQSGEPVDLPKANREWVAKVAWPALDGRAGSA